MAYATGTRILACLSFVVGLVTVVGAIVLWPLAYFLTKKAQEKEQEREAELGAV
jgi:hypothetical protein